MAPKLKPETLEERKNQILNAALSCFARKGFHQTTMDDIVEAAGLSKGGVYWHFGSKKELFLTLIGPLMGDTEAILAAATDSDSPVSATERLNGVMDAMTAMVTDDAFREMTPLMIDVWAQIWRDAEVNKVAVRMYEGFRRPLVNLVEEGIAGGEFQPVNADSFAGIVMALYDGLMIQWMVDETAVDWGVARETLINTLVAGLLTDAAG